jgi:transcriptional regulator with XRE-family HTH domain
VDAFLQRQICSRVQQARKEAGFTQDEMADLLGMTMRGYQNYETDRVPWRKLDKIADLVGVTQMWLLRGDPDERTESGATPPLPDGVIERLDKIEESVESLRQAVLSALETRGGRRAAG